MAANLKLDLLNKLRNDKFYEEVELIRLAGDPNMNYREKIERIGLSLQNLAIVNSQLALAEQYFQEQPAPQVAPAQVPVQGVVHPGQTFGE